MSQRSSHYQGPACAVVRTTSLSSTPLHSAVFEPSAASRRRIRKQSTALRTLRLLFVSLFVLGFPAMLLFTAPPAISDDTHSDNGGRAALGSQNGFVAVIQMNMMIAPGAKSHLEERLFEAHREGARALIVQLDTPGGMLNTTQEMIQLVFRSPIPVYFYVSPSGGTATSAGVFLTLAGHVAAMAPGTTIGAATPVLAGGQDIQDDMRAKALNITMAMVRSIADERGRNVEWAENAVREASSLTEREAKEQGVIDFIAEDVDDLLRQAQGKTVKVLSSEVTLEDWSELPRRMLDISARNRVVNVLADPSILAILWLAATTGISIELYNPGLIFPGLIGIICLILALTVSSVIPVSQGATILLVLGGILIAADTFVGSGILAVGGVIAVVLGAMYLVDVSMAPGMDVNFAVIIPVLLVIVGGILWIAWAASQSRQQRRTTGAEGLVGLRGRAMGNLSPRGKALVSGEIWDVLSDGGLIVKDDSVEVVAIEPGMVLRVKKLE